MDHIFKFLRFLCISKGSQAAKKTSVFQNIRKYAFSLWKLSGWLFFFFNVDVLKILKSSVSVIKMFKFTVIIIFVSNGFIIVYNRCNIGSRTSIHYNCNIFISYKYWRIDINRSISIYKNQICIIYNNYSIGILSLDDRSSVDQYFLECPSILPLYSGH